MPKMQNNTTKIFQLKYAIHSFFTSNFDRNIFIQYNNKKYCNTNIANKFFLIKLFAVKNVRHGAKNVQHCAKDLQHGAENVRHDAKNV